MLILAGVTISIAINGGLFGQAQTSVEQTKIEQGREEINIILAGMQIDQEGKLTIQNIIENIQNFDEGNIIVYIEEIGNEEVEIEHKNGYIYTIDENLEIKEDVQRGNVPGLTEENITIAQTPSTWTTRTITVTMQTTVEGYRLQYSKDNVNWNDYTGEVSYTENGTIYARLTNGTDYGRKITQKIEYIDTLKPNAPTITVAVLSTSVTITSSAEDSDATELSGSSGISHYYYSINGTSWQGMNTFSNLTPSTSYTIYVKAFDNAGNASEVATQNITTKVGVPHSNIWGLQSQVLYKIVSNGVGQAICRSCSALHPTKVSINMFQTWRVGDVLHCNLPDDSIPAVGSSLSWGTCPNY